MFCRMLYNLLWKYSWISFYFLRVFSTRQEESWLILISEGFSSYPSSVSLKMMSISILIWWPLVVLTRMECIFYHPSSASLRVLLFASQLTDIISNLTIPPSFLFYLFLSNKISLYSLVRWSSVDLFVLSFRPFLCLSLSPSFFLFRAYSRPFFPSDQF